MLVATDIVCRFVGGHLADAAKKQTPHPSGSAAFVVFLPGIAKIGRQVGGLQLTGIVEHACLMDHPTRLVLIHPWQHHHPHDDRVTTTAGECVVSGGGWRDDLRAGGAGHRSCTNAGEDAACWISAARIVRERHFLSGTDNAGICGQFWWGDISCNEECIRADTAIVTLTRYRKWSWRGVLRSVNWISATYRATRVKAECSALRGIARCRVV